VQDQNGSNYGMSNTVTAKHYCNTRICIPKNCMVDPDIIEHRVIIKKKLMQATHIALSASMLSGLKTPYSQHLPFLIEVSWPHLGHHLSDWSHSPWKWKLDCFSHFYTAMPSCVKIGRPYPLPKLPFPMGLSGTDPHLIHGSHLSKWHLNPSIQSAVVPQLTRQTYRPTDGAHNTTDTYRLLTL